MSSAPPDLFRNCVQGDHGCQILQSGASYLSQGFVMFFHASCQGLSVQYSISQSAGGTSQNIIFKTLRQIGRPAPLCKFVDLFLNFHHLSSLLCNLCSLCSFQVSHNVLMSQCSLGSKKSNLMPEQKWLGCCPKGPCGFNQSSDKKRGKHEPVYNSKRN